MADPYLGEIRMFAGTFAPLHWAFCNGQLIAISENQALFSLLGTTYGGDGRSSFGLPDMRGRLPMHQGQGPGLSNRIIGQRFGTETVTLTPAEIPPHQHTMAASSEIANSSSPQNAVLAHQVDDTLYTPNGTAIDGSKLMSMADSAVSPTGDNRGHNNLMPSQCLSFIIAMHGVYPSRN
ncbi:phage tail protein [Ferrimonas pelagia]|uniref:Tail fiber protein n=1 Tax=Ferrimonas pelagia TaxID=1177826 RepID=A0ABP9EC34_9GAMM